MLEIIAETVEDALAAQAGGATQLDLECAFSEGGLTPSAGLIEQVRASVSIDVLPLIRPHSRSFVYSKSDVAIMCSDARVAVKLGVQGLLVGCLTADGKVDVEAMKALRDAAGGCPMHFHIAWELARSPEEALEVIIGLGLRGVRITGHVPAAAPDGDERQERAHPVVAAGGAAHSGKTEAQLAQIRHFVVQAARRVELYVVGGVNADNVGRIVAGTGVHNVHSGSGVRVPPARGGVVSEREVRRLADALQRASPEL